MSRDCIAIVVVLAPVFVATGCSGCSHQDSEDTGTPHDGSAEDGATTDDASSPGHDGSSTDPPPIAPIIDDGTVWIDAHTHCRPRPLDAAGEVVEIDRERLFANPSVADRVTRFECDPEAWRSTIRGDGPGEAVVLTTSYGLVPPADAPREAVEAADRLARLLADSFAEAADADDSLILFGSLDCLYDTRLADPGFVQACKEDAERWVERGAVGFKDYVGGNWLPDWNLANGHCSASTDCMTQSTVRYLLLEDAWREVLRYVLEELGAAVLSHATYNHFDGKPCFDPLGGAIDDCGTVTIDHLVDFARWAEAELTPDARRRFIVAHLGLVLPDRHDQVERFDEFMAAGLSTDVSGNLEGLDRDGCELRRILARYPEQILFGTDLSVNGPAECGLAIRDAYLYAVGGDSGSTRRVQLCDKGPIDVQGMALDQPVVAGCDAGVPAGFHRMVLRENFVSLFAHD